MDAFYFFFFFCREGESGSWNRSVETHSNATSQYIDGLNPYTVYLFRVAAENALGYSKPGKESYPTLTHRERESYFSAGFPSSVFNLYFATVFSTVLCYKIQIKANTVGLPLCYFYGTKKFGHSISKWGCVLSLLK